MKSSLWHSRSYQEQREKQSVLLRNLVSKIIQDKNNHERVFLRASEKLDYHKFMEVSKYTIKRRIDSLVERLVISNETSRVNDLKRYIQKFQYIEEQNENCQSIMMIVFSLFNTNQEEWYESPLYQSCYTSFDNSRNEESILNTSFNKHIKTSPHFSVKEWLQEIEEYDEFASISSDNNDCDVMDTTTAISNEVLEKDHNFLNYKNIEKKNLDVNIEKNGLRNNVIEQVEDNELITTERIYSEKNIINFSKNEVKDLDFITCNSLQIKNPNLIESKNILKIKQSKDKVGYDQNKKSSFQQSISSSKSHINNNKYTKLSLTSRLKTSSIKKSQKTHKISTGSSNHLTISNNFINNYDVTPSISKMVTNNFHCRRILQPINK